MTHSSVRKTLVALVGAGTIALGLAAPAAAQSRSVTDRRGDAWPAIDVTAATFTNNGRLVTARLHVADLRWVGHFTLTMYTVDPEEAEYNVDLAVSRDHSKKVTVGVISRGGSWRGKCAASAITTRYLAKKDVVLFKVPRACIPQIGRHPAVTFSVETLRMRNGRIASTDEVSGGTVKHSR